jgi:hypothetical protein
MRRDEARRYALPVLRRARKQYLRIAYAGACRAPPRMELARR